MKSLLLITISLLFSSFLVKAQEDSVLEIPDKALSWFNPVTNTDSLKDLLDGARGHARVDMLCELVFALQRTNRSEKRLPYYIDEAFSLAEKMDYGDGMVKALLLKGYQYRRVENDFQRSIEVLQKEEDIFEPQTHWTLKFRVWSAIAHNYQNINDGFNAIEYFQKGHLSLDKDTAWYAFLKSHFYLMQQASLINEHAMKRHYMIKLDSLFKKNEKFLPVQGFRLLNNAEELSINMANYGEYKDALELMQWVMEVIEKEKGKSFYIDFYHAKIMSRIARIYSHWGKYEEAMICFDESISRFEKVYRLYYDETKNGAQQPSLRQWYIGMANQLEERADVLIRKGILLQAEKDILESIEIRTSYPDPLGIAMCYDKLGELYAIRGKFMEALQWYDSSLEIKNEVIEQVLTNRNILVARVLFARESIASTYLKKGQLFKNQNRFPAAFGFFNLSLSVSREVGFQRGEAEALIALGGLHQLLHKDELALEFYQQAASIYEKMGHKPGKADGLERMGDFYFQQGMVDQAGAYYKNSKQIFEELDMPAKIAGLLIRQGNLLAAQQDSQHAIAKYVKAHYIADQLNLPKEKMEAFMGLADTYLSMGFYKEAFTNYKNYQAIKDELFNLEVERHIAEIEAAFETEKNRQHLLLLQSEKELMEEKSARSNLIILIMIVFIATLLIFMLMYFRQSRLKNGHERILLQQKLFRSQMNPHFIFNSLGSIQSSIINEEPRLAVKYLSRFSKLMRSILDSSIHETISLSKELSTIENYLALQKARFPQKFDYVISGAENIDTETLCVPPMLAQPFIENAIEHGIKHKEIKGLVSVNYQLTGNLLSIVIEDDGIGRKKAGELLKKHDKDHISMAIDITTQRIALLNRRSSQPIRFQIEDLCDANGQAAGTRVVFELPV